MRGEVVSPDGKVHRMVGCTLGQANIGRERWVGGLRSGVSGIWLFLMLEPLAASFRALTPYPVLRYGRLGSKGGSAPHALSTK